MGWISDVIDDRLNKNFYEEEARCTLIWAKVNGCTRKIGKSVIQAVDSAGLHIVPVSFEKASLLVFQEYPNLIVVDYTVPATVNDNAELYGKVGVPFVMGTTVGDRDRLYRTVEESKVYAVVAFLAAMEIMAEQFPGAFSGYNLQCLHTIGSLFVTSFLGLVFTVSCLGVMESHQAGKLDTSGTAKAIISCFQKLGWVGGGGIQMIRDPKQQIEMMGVVEEHLSGHACHLYHLTSPDQTY
ncbi:hypothetical protein E1A91_D09G145800v1 [Gossypium mustelinum]|uniref:Dihydrodipicolinate reductase N-terminal domain-containing protein n=1 Tax=Gossypium mustelinum TaxID=34275 RepID=A0A5D2TJD3_GOSMU|nr:hypothetical protein E1A91_D09G145800v1 [Gossypium mustelinum]